MSTFHAVVWLDHQEAHVLSFDKEHVESQKVRTRSHHKHQGHAGPDSAFFPAVLGALQGAHEVLVCGPGSARDEFAAWVRKHRPDAATRLVGSVPSDHPTDGQLVALARKYFVRFDQFAGDAGLRHPA
jgi:stalled ribosome rescue protein Dom34